MVVPAAGKPVVAAAADKQPVVGEGVVGTRQARAERKVVGGCTSCKMLDFDEIILFYFKFSIYFHKHLAILAKMFRNR